MTDAEIDEFLSGRNSMNVATHGPDGSIHLVAMWYGPFEGSWGFHTFEKSQKVRNLQRDPRVTVLVETGEVYEELRGVEMVGRAELITDADRLVGLVKSVAQRYYPIDDPAQLDAVAEASARKRVGVLIHPDRIVSWDHSKLGGVY